MAPPSQLLCRSSNGNTAGLAKISGNNKHCVVVKSITRKPLLFLQTLSQQHVCSRRGFSRLKLRELSGLERFEQLHHSACKVLQPDPAGLAKFLLEREMASDWEVFYNGAETYADILGKSGLAAYRVLAEAEWEKIRPLSFAEERPERFGCRFRIGQIMERFADRKSTRLNFSHLGI